MTDYCTSCLYEDYDGAEEPCINCFRIKDKKPTEYFPKRPTKPVTNADRVRSMREEELAEFLTSIRSELICRFSVNEECIDPDLPCEVCWLNWLKAGVQDV